MLAALFVLGTAETFADIGDQSAPARASSGARTWASPTPGCRAACCSPTSSSAPPIGALLFAIGMALPFVANAAGFALGAVVISRIVYSQAAEPASTARRRHWRHEMAEGLRWLAGHPPMRTLAITIVAFNITFGAAWSVLVLYAQERLGMTDVGFGLITTAMAIGGIIGTTSYGALERRFALGDIMRVGLLIETAPTSCSP